MLPAWRLPAALALLCVLARSACAIDLYGAAPDAFAYVGDGDTFACDGDKLLPVSKLNDDYCDCADGSDEPGAFSLQSRCLCRRSPANCAQARPPAPTASSTAPTAATRRRTSSPRA
jgi:hypothetical protein